MQINSFKYVQHTGHTPSNILWVWTISSVIIFFIVVFMVHTLVHVSYFFLKNLRVCQNKLISNLFFYVYYPITPHFAAGRHSLNKYSNTQTNMTRNGTHIFLISSSREFQVCKIYLFKISKHIIFGSFVKNLPILRINNVKEWIC